MLQEENIPDKAASSDMQEDFVEPAEKIVGEVVREHQGNIVYSPAQVADMIGITAAAVRQFISSYADVFPDKAVSKADQNGYAPRMNLTPEDVEKIHKIRELRSKGYTKREVIGAFVPVEDTALVYNRPAYIEVVQALKDMREQYAVSRRNNEAIQESMSNISRSLSELVNQNQMLHNDLSDVRAENSELANKNVMLQDKIAMQEYQEAALRESNAELERQREELLRKVEELEKKKGFFARLFG